MPKLTQSEVVDAWIKAKCKLEGNCAFKALYASYSAFAIEHSYPTLSKAALALMMLSLGLPGYRATDHIPYRTGINLVAEA